MKASIPLAAQEILSVFDHAGVEAWLVGGSVRDSLLGKKPDDLDLATAASPQQIQALFAHTIPTGARYGTITVLWKDTHAEITTFRKEQGTDDARHPQAVVFGGTIEEDLSRRDFTLNAMAWHPQRGILDPFGGQQDLQAGLLRAVGEPALRFQEDALRILRVYRFSSQLGFTIEPNTYAAARQSMALTAFLSGERIQAEWRKLLCGQHPALAFTPDLLQFWRELGFAFHLLAEKTARFDELPPTPTVRWGAFFYLMGLPLEEVGKRLHFSNQTKREIADLFRLLREPFLADKKALKKWLAVLPVHSLEQSLQIRTILLQENTAIARENLTAVLAYQEPYLVRHLALKGKELMALGFVGPACGEAQQLLLAHVLSFPEENTKERLKAFLRALPLS